MMNAHPKIASIGELSAIEKVANWDNYYCSCGELFINCDFWNRFYQELGEKKIGVFNSCATQLKPDINRILDRVSLHYFNNKALNCLKDYLVMKIPAYKKYFSDYIRGYLDCADVILGISNKSIFFDTSKNPYTIKLLRSEIGKKLKIIHLVKDGRGVLDSFLRYSLELEEAKTIKSWVKTNNTIEYEKGKLPLEDIIMIRYKDLAVNTRSTIEKICNFIEVDFDDSVYGFMEHEHHILGNNKMRKSRSSEIFFDEKWKKSLTDKQLKLFHELGHHVNKKYGI